MYVYLNRGLILEQAICSLLHDYIDTLNLSNLYKNYHIDVTTEHPFAELFFFFFKNAAGTRGYDTGRPKNAGIKRNADTDSRSGRN